MNENQDRQNDLVDTTDCLEAIGVFRCWKNGLFVIIALCLLLLQVCFWLVDTGCVKAEDKAATSETTAPLTKPPPVVTPPPAKDLVVPLEEKQTSQSAEISDKIEKAAEQTVAEPPNQPAEPASQPAPVLSCESKNGGEQQQKAGTLLGIKFKHLSWLIRFLNFVLILAAALYCLTMLFSLKVSLLGRLGGISHIARAFFLSLTLVVLLLPWQRLFAPVIVGAIYTPNELLSSYAQQTGGIFAAALYYLRFTGCWLLVLLLLILSQLRSARWAKAILRRLEII